MKTLSRSSVALGLILLAWGASGGCSLMPATNSEPTIGPFMNDSDPPTREPAHDTLDQSGFLDSVKGP